MKSRQKIGDGECIRSLEYSHLSTMQREFAIEAASMQLCLSRISYACQ